LDLNLEFEAELGARGLPVAEELLAMAAGEEEKRDLLCNKADLLAAAGLRDEAEAIYHAVNDHDAALALRPLPLRALPDEGQGGRSDGGAPRTGGG